MYAPEIEQVYAELEAESDQRQRTVLACWASDLADEDELSNGFTITDTP